MALMKRLLLSSSACIGQASQPALAHCCAHRREGLEKMILDFERKGATDDAAITLEILRCLAPEHVYQDIVFRLPGRERYPDPKDWFM